MSTTFSYRFRRLIAAALDVAALIGVTLLASRWLLRFANPARPRRVLVGVALLLLLAALPVLLALLRDALGGRSPGKLLTGLRATDVSTGRGIGGLQSITRNGPMALLVIGLLPQASLLAIPARLRLVAIAVGLVIAGLPALIAAIQIAAGQSQRVGESFAGTLVQDA